MNNETEFANQDEEISYKGMWLSLKSYLTQDVERAKEAIPLWLDDDKNNGLWACQELIDRARYYKEVLGEAERLERFEK